MSYLIRQQYHCYPANGHNLIDIIGNSGLFSLDSSLRWNDRPGQYHPGVFIGCHSSEGWNPVLAQKLQEFAIIVLFPIMSNAQSFDGIGIREQWAQGPPNIINGFAGTIVAKNLHKRYYIFIRESCRYKAYSSVLV